MLKATATANIIFTEIVENNGKPFLAATLAVSDRDDNSIRILIRTSNGLLEAAQKGEKLVGQRVTITGDIALDSLRSHYTTQEGVNKTLQNPEFRLNYISIERHGSRPAVEAGENLGFLPGDMKDKVDPYLRPIYDALYEMMPFETVEKKIQEGIIEIAPVAFMRGRTFKNSFIIIDEAQNTSSIQMKMILTRLGNGSKMIINGDLTQIDIKYINDSGLSTAKKKLSNLKTIKFINLNKKDVVRHKIVSEILSAYEK